MLKKAKNTSRDAESSSAISVDISRTALRELAGARSFERGEDYFEGGCMGRLAEYQNRVTASVQGTRKYVVKLSTEGGRLLHDCTCPVGQDGSFCKYCAAVGLAWLAQHETAARISGTSKIPSLTMEDVQTHLMEQGKEFLVEMLVEQALQDERLRERLLMKVATHRAKTSGGKANIQPFIDAIDNAVESHEFVAYREVPGYAHGIEDAIETVETLLKDGHAVEAMQVSEYALGAVHRAIGYVDDSDGCAGGILYRIAELHLAACKKARPDPEALAQRIILKTHCPST